MNEQLLDQKESEFSLYDECLEIKQEGASNGDLRSFLREQNIAEDLISDIVKRVDSDFLNGVGAKKPESALSETTRRLIGWLLVVMGLTVLILFYLNGGAGLIPVLVCFMLSMGGLAMIRSASEKNMKERKKKKKISSGYFKRE
jgi:hypothetical protein